MVWRSDFLRSVIKRICALAIIVLLLFPGTALAAASNAKPSQSVSTWNEENPGALKDGNLHGQSAILIDAKTGRVLYDKNSDLCLYPASTTKVMTAMLALEKCDLNDVVSASRLAAATEATHIPVKYEEKFTVKDLLHALMLISANDAGVMLAEHIGGSLEGFSEMMNQKAEALGCTNTNLTVPHGLPDTKHYSTAADMAKIAMAAMQNETFRKIVATPNYTLSPTNKTDKSRTLENKNRMLPTSGDAFSYEWCIGIKTGYTKASAHTFVSAASKDGVELICVIFGTTADGKWLDAEKLFEYGFSQYAALDVAGLYTAAPVSCNVDNSDAGDSGLLRLDIADTASLNGIIAKKEIVQNIEENFFQYAKVEYLSESVQAPLNAGDPVAKLVFTLDGASEPIQVDLVASRTVSALLPDATIVDPSSQAAYAAAGMPPTFDQIAQSASSSPIRYLAFLLLIPFVLLIGLIVSMALEMNRRRRRRSRPRGYTVSSSALRRR